MPKPDELAEMVVLAIKAALAPVLAKQEAMQVEIVGLRQSLADRSQEQAVGALVERMVAVETKAAQPVPLPDLTEVRDRIVAIETRLAGPSAQDAVRESTKEMGALRERVTAIETRAVQPPDTQWLDAIRDRVVAIETRIAGPTAPEAVLSVTQDVGTLRERMATLESKAAPSLELPDVEAIRDRVVALETRIAGPTASETVLDVTKDVGLLRERIGVLETKAVVPAAVPDSKPDDALIDLRARIASLETKLQSDATVQELSGLRERVAVLETRAPIPGPPGAPGRDGLDGTNGSDGVGWDDMATAYDDEGRLSLTFAKGAHVTSVRVPGFVDRGPYREGELYEKGDGVSFGGGFWIARAETSAKPGETGEGSRAWRLVVKKGRDGRDARPYTPPTSLPVVRTDANG